MVIESRFWKEDLLCHARCLKPVKNPPRWSEKRVVNFEKDLVVSFLKIRMLLEADTKLSSQSRNYRIPLYFSPVLKGVKVHKRNRFELEEIYELDGELLQLKSLAFVANQFIHQCTMFALRSEDRNWESVYVCSDKERDKGIYRILISEIRKALTVVGHDYPTSHSCEWDEKIEDYVWKERE
ncbi:MAG: hypothetical protein HND56_07905 [Pseudomonadota bacterium]|nr:hypothetical protein [Pseudomonadota bacterium]QKK05613.1 MAG: hypothetical protein HND56_07905 [Pseudomonadota bacterium]